MSTCTARQPKHVTFVLWQFPEDGGCGRATELLGRAFARRGVAVDFISMVPGVSPTDLDTRSVLRLTDAHRRPVFREATGFAQKLRGLQLLLRKRVDAVYGLRRARRLLEPLDSSSVVIFTNVGPKRMLSESGYRPAAHGPIVIGQHHSSYDGARATGQLDDMPEYFGDLDAFVTLTEEDAQRFQDLLPVPCSAIANIAQIPAEPRAAHSREVAVTLTRYAREKRLDVMINAFDEATKLPALRAWTLHLYGSGDLREELQTMVDDLGLDDRVHLHHRTNDVSHVLDGAAVNLMSSEYEGFPMAVLEASAHGVPTVAFDCSAGMRQLVSPATGALVPQDDFEGYVTALRELMVDAAQRQARGAAARDSVERYSEGQVIDHWLALFDECARRRSRGEVP
ncbi:hypothetical protein ASC64_02755 [Nocardioides sp. Root122]|uniref:glycosyltransferase n=1 Tax=Nocardioides TaxID=1839 RepID=UPI000702602A|nr:MULTISPECIES: glycosyltransferase [Nocardioides]KQV77763.1 hypothetical protein ASC64_02755 [Nocardioides sp. Root122]MCK9822231.1 glycosyltransferase [Nocardioides cavernae]